ncbi:2-amino-4-hydroxy-6-hydroxymethyldihydropteridine diphosphokinase [Maribellus sediminis]|uniref:2-amino-4-hydroxy-6- hydroxymethyldihydropteridine diphosphokinase n=1 Tax=Maribellus sediminis TaxID=2696285 RepID=UPI00142F9E1B|nr:2-amino-4-hydroxy-6-hydroxymethyldihydropteridine diphosphokinase [Maribellus sediminis]
MNSCIIGIGSNIDADKNISQMLEILKSKVKVIKVSPMIRTKPVGIKEQPDYTNGAVKIETEKDRASLTKLLKEIEDQLGRDRCGPKFGPRTMDLDIVVWNGEIVDQDYFTREFIRTSVRAVDEGPFPD